MKKLNRSPVRGMAPLARVLKLSVFLQLLVGCQDGAPRANPGDVGLLVPDQSIVHDAQTLDAELVSDSGLQDVGVERSLDVGTEDGAILSDAENADGALPVLDTVQLRLGEAVVDGPHTVLSDGRMLLDRGAGISFPLTDGVDFRQRDVVAVFRGTVWRYEDGLISVGFEGDLQHALVPGDGLSSPVVVSADYSTWDEPPAFEERLPPQLRFQNRDASDVFRLVSREGGLIVEGIDLLDARQIEFTPNPVPQTPTDLVLDFSSCAEEPNCDDGARLTEMIAQAPEGSITIRLRSSAYRATTPVRITRAHIRITGENDEGEQRPTWLWDPVANSGQRWPFEVRGGGPNAQAALTVVGSIRSGTRRILLDGALPDGTRWMRLTADDFGVVPPICVDGRDIERTNRHQRQLFAVLAAEVVEGQTHVTLDRAINLDIPSMARPRLTPTELVEGFTLTHVRLNANCPQALEQRFREANCENPEVLDDGGVLLNYTHGAVLEAVDGQGFGKFTIEVLDSLLTEVRNCSMSYPAAYGSGGQGYGVHLIGASRSVIVDQEVEYARHGVVVDFGSSDSQVLNGRFSDMNQALLDVHGEASRDTLIRGNQLSRATIGVIVGGGGRTVHCNDGPRHHIIDNAISEVSITAVSVTDYTEQTAVRSNVFDDNSGHVLVSFGASDVLIERNVFGPASIAPLGVSFDDVRGVMVQRNIFTDVCDEVDAHLSFGNAQPPMYRDNVFCPDMQEN